MPVAFSPVNSSLPLLAGVLEATGHAPEDAQVVALVLDHVSVDEPLIDTNVELASSVTVGVGVGVGVGVLPDVSLKK